MSEFKGTPVPWEWISDDYLVGSDGCPVLRASDDGKSYGMHSAMIEHGSPECVKDANKALIIEASTVLHTTGRTPRELAADNAKLAERVKVLEGQRDTLLGICRQVVGYHRQVGVFGLRLERLIDFIHMMRVAIEECTEGQAGGEGLCQQ